MRQISLPGGAGNLTGLIQKLLQILSHLFDRFISNNLSFFFGP